MVSSAWLHIQQLHFGHVMCDVPQLQNCLAEQGLGKEALRCK